MKSRLAVAASVNAVATLDLSFAAGSSYVLGGRHAMPGSMGHVGAAGDNAAMESFALPQNNVLDRRSCATREDLQDDES